MHELSICQSLVDIVAEEAVRQDVRIVRAIRLEVGPFASIEEGALRFAFEVAAAGTVCAGARLDLLALPVEAWCFDCDAAIEIRDRVGTCPTCGGGRVTAGKADSLRIKDIEVA